MSAGGSGFALDERQALSSQLSALIPRLLPFLPLVGRGFRSLLKSTAFPQRGPKRLVWVLAFVQFQVSKTRSFDKLRTGSGARCSLVVISLVPRSEKRDLRGTGAEI